MGNGIPQPVGVKLMLDHALAAPAGVAAVERRLAVALGGEELRDVGVLELFYRFDTVGFCALFVDQITLY